MFLYTEPKIAGSREVVTPQLVFSYLKATFQDFLCFGAPYRAVNGNFLVTADTERANRVPGFREDRLLAGELFQYLHQNITTVQNCTKIPTWRATNYQTELFLHSIHYYTKQFNVHFTCVTKQMSAVAELTG